MLVSNFFILLHRLIVQHVLLRACISEFLVVFPFTHGISVPFIVYREERVFRMWINSLNIENVYINNLFTDCRDGVNLIKTIDRVSPGLVVWKK